MKNKQLLLILSPLILVGCQTTSLSKVDNKTGAVALPVALKVSGFSSHPCGRLSFDIAGSERQVAMSYDPVEDMYVGYGLIDNLPPANYEIESFKCHAKSKRIFNNGLSYLEFPTNFSFDVEANQLTISKVGFYGEATRSGSNSSFNIQMIDFGTEGQKEVLESFPVDQAKSNGWAITN